METNVNKMNNQATNFYNYLNFRKYFFERRDAEFQRFIGIEERLQRVAFATCRARRECRTALRTLYDDLTSLGELLDNQRPHLLCVQYFTFES